MNSSQACQCQKCTAPHSWEPPSAEKMKRLTIDIPEDLHRRIKVTCVATGAATMADRIRELLEREFASR